MSKVKLAFQMIVFNGDHVLEPCLKSIQPYGPIFVTEGPVRYWLSKGFKGSTDRTNEILDKYVPEKNIVRGQWPEKDEMQNAVSHLIPEDTTHVWLVDSDEIWKAQDIEAVIKLLETEDYDSMSFKATSFYGGFDRFMTGFEENFEVHRIQRWYPGAKWHTHRPPTVLNPITNKPWREHKHLNHLQTDALALRYFHYSYVFPSQMRMKAEYYQDMSPGLVIPDYFEQIYKPWVLGDTVTKRQIEDRFLGVHNWQPSARGPCRTLPFVGSHPDEILNDWAALTKRFNTELLELGRE